jgi:hypothetical protein
MWKNQAHLILRARTHYFRRFYNRHWKIWKLKLINIESAEKKVLLIRNVIFHCVNPGLSEMAGLGQDSTIVKKKASCKILFVLAPKKQIFKKFLL